MALDLKALQDPLVELDNPVLQELQEVLEVQEAQAVLVRKGNQASQVSPDYLVLQEMQVLMAIQV